MVHWETSGMPAQVVGSLKAASAAKASPVSAQSIGRRPGLFALLRQFNNKTI
jgi:hypothetical protein